MKKKGFTLIELLAVIVVLAIIALIATPIVMNTIKKSQKGAAERSADNYISAVETALATAKLDSDGIPDGIYTINDKGNLEGNGLKTPLEIEMSGNKPTGGTITIKNGQVTTDSKMTVGSYEISYNPTTKKYESSDEANGKTYTNGEIVYFNVTTGEKCSSSDYTETQSNTGVKEGCMRFYAFNDNRGETVNLILDHNTTATVVWNSSKSNASGPKEALDQLKTDTASWQGTETPTNYTIDQTEQTSKAKYTIDYSSYKARLITANEVAQITGNTSWDEKNADTMYYLASNSTERDMCKIGCKYGWLYDRTRTDCTSFGCSNNSDQMNYGYWTISPNATGTDSAWIVFYFGSVNSATVNYSGLPGVRPVIEVLKSKLS